jgi:maltooligosyltrehalose trehalohydrolase
MLAFYRALIALRRRTPALANGRKDLTRVEFDEAGRWLTIERGDPNGGAALTLANLGDRPADLPVPRRPGGWRLTLSTRPDAGVTNNRAPGPLMSLPPATALVLAGD